MTFIDSVYFMSLYIKGKNGPPGAGIAAPSPLQSETRLWMLLNL
jgi:hypothetical protein